MPAKPRRGKRVRHIDYFDDPILAEDELQLERAIHRHTEFASHDNGWSTRTSYIEAGSSPPRAPDSPLRIETNLYQGDPILYDLEDTSEEIDPDIIHEMAELELDEYHKRRRRTTGVSKHIFHSLWLANIRCLQDDPMREWVSSRDDWLAELLRSEGRGDFAQAQCARCGNNPAEIRCKDCEDHKLYCEPCTVDMHRRNPFHRILVSPRLYFPAVEAFC